MPDHGDLYEHTTLRQLGNVCGVSYREAPSEPLYQVERFTLTAESSTEMKARQGYRLRKMIWPAGAGKNLHKENSLPSAGSPFWKRNPRIRSRKESTSTFYYLDKPVKTRLSCDKQLGNGKYRESESNIYNKFIDFEWMSYPGNACCNESLFLACISESGMTGEKNRRVLE